MTNIYAEVYKCLGTGVINLDLIMEEEKKASSLLLFLLSLGRDRKYILRFPSAAFRRSRESASPSRRSPAPPLLDGEEGTYEFISCFSSRQMAQARSQCYFGDNPVSQRPTSYSQLARRV